MNPLLTAESQPLSTVEVAHNDAATRPMELLQHAIVESEVHEPGRWQKAGRYAAGAAVVAAAGIALAFEQSPTNEMIRVNAALDELANSHSPVRAALTVAGITTAVELAAGSLVALGLHSQKGAVKWISNRAKANRAKQIEKVGAERYNGTQKSFIGKVANQGADVLTALGVGAGLVTLRRHVLRDEKSLRKDMATTLKATATVAAVSGGITYLLTGGMNRVHELNVPPLTWSAEKLVEYGDETKLYIGALAVGYGIKYGIKGAKAGVQKIRKNKQLEPLRTPILDTIPVHAVEAEPSYISNVQSDCPQKAPLNLGVSMFSRPSLISGIEGDR